MDTMIVEAELAPDPTEQPAPGVVRRPPSQAALVVLGVGVALARWWFSHDRSVFHVAPDEPAQLAIGRWLSGGTDWNMFDHSTWRPLLATLIAPIYWVTDDPAEVVRGALMINAAVAGVAAVVLARLAYRLTRLTALGCVLAAGAVAVAPASLSASANVWAESLLTATFLATLWYLLEFFDRPRLAPALAAVGWAAIGFTAHSRALPMIPVAAALTIGALLWRREWRRAAMVGAFTAFATIAAYEYADFIFSRVWDSPADNNTVRTVWERMDDPGELGEAIVGQLWYQLVATIGLFGVGSIIVVRTCFRRRPRPSASTVDDHDDGQDDADDTFDHDVERDHDVDHHPDHEYVRDPDHAHHHEYLRGRDDCDDRDTGPAPASGEHLPSTAGLVERTGALVARDARVIAAMTVPLLGLSVAFMSNRTRSDHLIYGRYNDAVVWPVLVIAIAWFVGLGDRDAPSRSRWMIPLVAAALVASGAGVYALHNEQLSDSVGVRPMIAGLIAWIGGGSTIDVVRLTGFGLAGLLVLTLVSIWPGPRSAVLIGVAALALLVGGVRTHTGLGLRLNVWGQAAAVTEIDDLIPPDAEIGVRFVRDSDDPEASWGDQRRRAQLYQMYLPEHTFVRDRGTDDSVGPWVFAPVGDPDMEAAGAEVLWTDPRIDLALWQEAIEP